MDNSPEPIEEPANLKFLRQLVTLLTAVMIAGVVVVVALLVIRLRSPAAELPAQIALPDGTRVSSFTVGPDWYAVVTRDDRILIFDQADGALRQTIAILPAGQAD